MVAIHLRDGIVILLGLLAFGRCEEEEQVKHPGHGRNMSHSDDVNDDSTIDAPLVVNCSVPVCEGPLKEIFCIGPILTAAWQFKLQDSCPGSRIKGTPQSVLDNFRKLTYPLNKATFTAFCDENFDNSHYLEPAQFTDWKDNPEILTKIGDPKKRQLALEVHRRWNVLGRKFVPDVLAHPELYPVTPVPNSFIVPGGYFDIYFYWDTYWIIEGLLISNMTETVKGIISNFASIVEAHGYIPNSGKLQLSSRSQPPVFTQMAYAYYVATGDLNYTRSILPTLEKELAFWEKERRFPVAKDGASYNVFQYKTKSNCPRPENFLLDYWQGLNNTRKAEDVWSSITSGCESGWDFSSRWFSQNGTDAYSKKSIHINSIVPVDLNVFMAWNYKALAVMYKKMNITSKASEYSKKSDDQIIVIDKMFWNEQEGIWLDYDMEIASAHRAFYPSNLFPLLVIKSTGDVIKRVGEYLEKNKIFEWPGGIPSTLPVNSTEQWDFPNVWAPTLHLFVMSLLSTRDAYLVEKAKETADKFAATVYRGMFEPPDGMKGGMWEKYDARKGDGSHGYGGEYAVQEGFGWTNGAVLHLIMMFDQPAEYGFETRRMSMESGKPTESNLTVMIGEFPNNFIVAGMVVVCLSLSVLFIVVSNHNLRRALERRRDRESRSERDQMSRLLQSMDSEEDEP